MKIYDMHTHIDIRSSCINPQPQQLLAEMEKAGVYGGCVFSCRPKENNAARGLDFEARLENVLAWTRDYPDRLFPVLWIHPYEENILEKVRIAAERGICAFKMICSNYFVYEEQCLTVLREIARLNLPVMFHSGILWDGECSSERNRPVNWEALIDIEGLRFSMGHCSWPWIDECIAMYGKFLNARTGRSTAEMFFDITPGTPPLYREELLTKLYALGYDVGDNVLFGTDCSSHEYSVSHTAGWLETDRRILDKLGVSLANRQKLYHDNLMRFLGRTDRMSEPNCPLPDDANSWSCTNPRVRGIIEYWYKALKFPSFYDYGFREALDTIPISDAISIETYDRNEPDGRRNLLSFLFMCERLKERYAEKGIDEQILLDTLSDIVVWTRTWFAVKGGLHLGELGWLNNHLRMKLFRLGRLQFCMGEAECDMPDAGVVKGDPVMEIHIAAIGPLDPEECRKSIEKARAFFARHYPDFHYKCFTCHSWLLDPALKPYLAEDSNIMQFQRLFTPVRHDPSDALLRYLFRRDTVFENVKYAYPASAFAARIQKAILSGVEFHESLGWMEA